MRKFQMAVVAVLVAVLTILGLGGINSADAATVPSPPQNAHATLSGTTAHITWDAPATDGGDPIYRYVVKVKGQSTPVIQINDPAARSYDWLNANATQIFQIRAVNHVGFSAWAETGVGSGPTPTPTTTSPTPTPTATQPTGSGITKILTFIEENHSLSQMQTGMPYTFGLAKQYGYANNYFAITHPSLPNYIAIAGGQTYGITDDGGPSKHPLNGSSIFGQALSKGKTAKLYAEGMSGNCSTVSVTGGKYAVKHNPWPYFTPEKTQCQQFDVPMTAFQADITNGNLPNVGMAIPNLCNDAHDCSLGVADNWFKGWMGKIFAGPDWKSGHLAVVLTADEDAHNQGNKVLTVVIHPSLHGKVVSQTLNHYSLTKFYEDTVGAPYLFNAANAADMGAAFGLDSSTPTPTPTTTSATPTPTETTETPTPTPTITSPTPTPTETNVGQPFAPYFGDTFYKSFVRSAPIDASLTTQFRNFMNTFPEQSGTKYPVIRGVGGNRWGTVYAEGNASDPIWKLTGTVPADVAILKTQGFHAPEWLGSVLTGTSDSPFVVMDRATGWSVWAAKAVPGANHTISVGTAGLFEHNSNGLDKRNPLSNSNLNFRSRGAIPDAMVIRKDEMDYAIAHNTSLGHVLHFFMVETDTLAGHVNPMVGHESGKNGFGAEGLRVRISPTIDLTTRGLSPAGLALARTLQDYGMYLGDNSGGVSTLKAEQENSAHPVWNGELTANSLRGITWDDFEVVSPGWQ